MALSDRNSRNQGIEQQTVMQPARETNEQPEIDSSLRLRRTNSNNGA